MSPSPSFLGLPTTSPPPSSSAQLTENCILRSVVLLARGHTHRTTVTPHLSTDPSPWWLGRDCGSPTQGWLRTLGEWPWQVLLVTLPFPGSAEVSWAAAQPLSASPSVWISPLAGEEVDPRLSQGPGLGSPWRLLVTNSPSPLGAGIYGNAIEPFSPQACLDFRPQVSAGAGPWDLGDMGVVGKGPAPLGT